MASQENTSEIRNKSGSFVDLDSLAPDDFPLIVFSDMTSGFVEFLIKWWTNAKYNHVMEMIGVGEFISQGNIFSAITTDRYTKKNNRLKFWKIKDITQEEKNAYRKAIYDDLNAPYYQRMYDYLGILGQIFKIRKINNPFKSYCSERVAKHLRVIGIDVPEHPSPHDLNEIFKTNPRFEVFGRWESD